MTRLIDADKLPNIYTATHQEMIMSFEEAPTVEAIPVEYIEGTMNRWKEIIGYEESVEALRILINNWKIERKEE